MHKNINILVSAILLSCFFISCNLFNNEEELADRLRLSAKDMGQEFQ
jgi:hypothetical protein